MTAQQLLDHCCGRAPKLYVKPKPITGIAKHERALDSIDDEYYNVFVKKEK